MVDLFFAFLVLTQNYALVATHVPPRGDPRTNQMTVFHVESITSPKSRHPNMYISGKIPNQSTELLYLPPRIAEVDGGTVHTTVSTVVYTVAPTW